MYFTALFQQSIVAAADIDMLQPSCSELIFQPTSIRTMIALNAFDRIFIIFVHHADEMDDIRQC